MKRTIITTAVVVGMLALAGCATAAPSDTGKTPDTSSVLTPAPTPEAEETAAPADATDYGDVVMSPRGNLVKEVGQLAGVTSEFDLTLARFAVTDIVLDPSCTSSWADPPQNGHFLALHFTVETTPELAGESDPSLWFSAYDFQAFDRDGKRVNDPQGNALFCMDDADTLPHSIGPGQSASGYIVLDVADTSGFVMMTMGANAVGWEWAY